MIMNYFSIKGTQEVGHIFIIEISGNPAVSHIATELMPANSSHQIHKERQ